MKKQMKSILTEQDLSGLDLTGAGTGISETIGAPALDETSRGHTAAASLSLNDMFTMDPSLLNFAEISSNAAARAGFCVARLVQDTAILMVTSLKGAFSLMPAAPDGTDGRDPGTLFIDTRESTGLMALKQADGSALVLQGQDEQLRLWEVLSQVAERLPGLRALVEQWTQNVSDQWLLETAQAHLAENSPFEQVVAAGLVSRLKPVPQGVAAKNAVAQLLSGGSDVSRPAERQWIRDQDGPLLDTLTQQCISRVQGIRNQLGALLEAPRPEDPAWQLKVTSLFKERDNLEGVRILLTEAGAKSGIEPLLKDCDEQGRQFVLAVPIATSVADDTQLKRAAAVSPQGWWVAPLSERA